MNCSRYNQKLHRIHINKEKDLDICVNVDCPIYRQPQGYHEARNEKLFEPACTLSRNSEGQLLRRERERLHGDRLTAVGETFTLHLRTKDGKHL